MPPPSVHVPFALIGAAVALAIPVSEGVRRLTAKRWAAEAPWPPVLTVGLAMSVSAGVAAPGVFDFGASLILGWTLIALVIVDLRVLRLPDPLTLPLIAFGIATTAITAPGELLGHLIAAAVGYGALAGIALVYRHVRSREGLGLGDAKLLAAAGAWLGWRALPAVLLIASLAGIAWALVRLSRPQNSRVDAPVAFGPALALAVWSCWLWGLVAI